LLAAGLASKLKTDDIPYGEDSPSALRRGASILELLNPGSPTLLDMILLLIDTHPFFS
jgi:hypothetical protein